jgi:hypothetical protein
MVVAEVAPDNSVANNPIVRVVKSPAIAGLLFWRLTRGASFLWEMTGNA